MPEYLAPGVYVEETSFRAKSLEGVGTSTTGFVGPTRKGPPGASLVGGNLAISTPEIITSFGDFERVYGGFDDLALPKATNYLAHAVRAYFDNGGSLLYVARVFEPASATDFGVASSKDLTNGGADPTKQTRFVARYPGDAGNGTIEVIAKDNPATVRTMGTAKDGTLVQTKGKAGTPDAFYVKRGDRWEDSGKNLLNLKDLKPGDRPEEASFITVSLVATDKDQHSETYQDLGLDPAHPLFIGKVFGMKQGRRLDDLEHMFGISVGSAITGFELRNGLFGASKDQLIPLTGGNDGAEPIQAAYENALQSLEKLDDISIVAAPGSSAYTDSQGIAEALIVHAEKRRAYRIAVLDTPPGQAVSDARDMRSKIDSSYAALYYPWVVGSNPLFRPGDAGTPRELTLPPSGFICGIYARSDELRGVIKAPANEVVQGALRFESNINFAEQEVLNPLGVNCLRFFPDRGYRVWGARTASSDPEWKYVNIRRYFIYLEATLDRGTQWAVFEPNGEALWRNVCETVSAFLYNEWVSGALLGSTKEEAYFVRCDRSTMTQYNLDNGQLICLVGVAALKPAEFVIFRIGQWTADAKS
jgi:phage tail sheath protein FI